MIFQMKDGARHMSHSPTEAKSNEENGWLTVSKEEFYDIGQTLEEDKRNLLVIAYIREFGKKPHHKKSIDTIKAELDGGTE